MLRNLILSLAVFGSAGIANAENLNYQPIVVFGQCTDTTSYAQMLKEQYGEEPILKGQAYIQVPNQKGDDLVMTEGMLVITTNYKSTTYSVSITFEDGNTCSLINGDKFFPWDYIEPEKEKL